jgi:hypothetical protein
MRSLLNCRAKNRTGQTFTANVRNKRGPTNEQHPANGLPRKHDSRRSRETYSESIEVVETSANQMIEVRSRRRAESRCGFVSRDEPR